MSSSAPPAATPVAAETAPKTSSGRNATTYYIVALVVAVVIAGIIAGGVIGGLSADQAAKQEAATSRRPPRTNASAGGVSSNDADQYAPPQVPEVAAERGEYPLFADLAAQRLGRGCQAQVAPGTQRELAEYTYEPLRPTEPYPINTLQCDSCNLGYAPTDDRHGTLRCQVHVPTQLVVGVYESTDEPDRMMLTVHRSTIDFDKIGVGSEQPGFTYRPNAVIQQELKCRALMDPCKPPKETLESQQRNSNAGRPPAQGLPSTIDTGVPRVSQYTYSSTSVVGPDDKVQDCVADCDADPNCRAVARVGGAQAAALIAAGTIATGGFAGVLLGGAAAAAAFNPEAQAELDKLGLGVLTPKLCTTVDDFVPPPDAPGERGGFQFAFVALRYREPGTRGYTAQKSRSGPERWRVIEGASNASSSEWQYQFTFFAYRRPHVGLVRVCIRDDGERLTRGFSSLSEALLDREEAQQVCANGRCNWFVDASACDGNIAPERSDTRAFYVWPLRRVPNVDRPPAPVDYVCDAWGGCYDPTAGAKAAEDEYKAQQGARNARTRPPSSSTPAPAPAAAV